MAEKRGQMLINLKEQEIHSLKRIIVAQEEQLKAMESNINDVTEATEVKFLKIQVTILFTFIFENIITFKPDELPI